MEPKVSVVVPIYNVEPFLNRCLESIVSQTYQNLEIILVDDGSPDNCPAMCDEWAKKDSRIQVVHKENAGLGMARNTGIDYAGGKYIFFLDSDDYVDVTLVEKCVASAEEHHSDVVIYGRKDVYEDGKIVEKPMNVCQMVFCEDQIKLGLLPYMFTYELGFGVSAWGKMFNLDTFKALNQRFFSEREIISEDAYFSLEFFSRIQKATIVNESLYFYYKRENSLSRVYRADRQQKNDDFLCKSVSYIEANGLPEKIATHVKARYHGLTLGNLAQIMRSDLSKEEKKTALKTVYTNHDLRKTLTMDVIRLDAFLPRVFWASLKMKLYGLCTLLLRLNNC